MSTKIALPRYARIGAGAVNDLGEIVQNLGSRRPAVITDGFLAGNGLADRVMALLRAAGAYPVMFSETVPDPTTDSLDAALRVIREHGADAVIGFGGGSPMEVAIAVKNDPRKVGQKLVLAMEVGTLCNAENKSSKLKNGLCSGWELVDADYDGTGRRLVAKLQSTGGLRMTFGLVPQS